MPPRPTHDGSDHSYRMVIEDRYKRMASMRRTIGVSAVVQLAYICARTLWHSIPFLTGEPRLTLSTEYIFGAGVALFALRAWAFGFGKAHRERLWAIMAYSLGSALLVAECTLIFYMYHIDANMMGRTAGKQYPQMLGKHCAGRLGLPAATLVLIATWFERLLDLVGLVAGFTNVWVTKEYVMERKAQAKEAAAKRE
ncbi:jagunal-like protein 1 [Chlorella sorokiniana]|jgi:hypothetical protein|uniref:Jagunal-like protein 1 n=1 Tax=Chlorella sorokiniana TaxID=3076 RepID=A0A2P6TYN0_CHLSO|nr:jagunal-like protein 1 [Chlorella sorokiniana]|eukprot:PRW59175.1 jagunal-like protein 1 [Chlorella sorokiniana]